MTNLTYITNETSPIYNAVSIDNLANFERLD